MRRIDSSTCTFSLRIESAVKSLGASMAINVISWLRWLWTMSRTTPAWS